MIIGEAVLVPMGAFFEGKKQKRRFPAEEPFSSASWSTGSTQPASYDEDTTEGVAEERLDAEVERARDKPSEGVEVTP